MNNKLKAAICIFLFIPIYLLLYTLLHEGGHALVILAYGGKIDKLVLGLNAHVVSHGGNFTAFGAKLNHAAGMLFPIIIGIIAISLYNFRNKLIGYHICYLWGTIALISSIFPWVLIPVISLFTEPPQGDDVTNFINAADFHPLLVSFGALLLAGAFIYLAYKKGLFKKAKEIYVLLRKNIKVNHKIGVTIAALGFVLAAAFFIFYYNTDSPPVIFSTSFTVDNALEANSRQDTFGIEKSDVYSVDIRFCYEKHCNYRGGKWYWLLSCRTAFIGRL